MPHSVEELLPIIRNAEGTIYGERLLTHVVESRAKSKPTRIVLGLPNSPDISQGLREYNYKELANAIDNLAWWLEEKLGGRGNFETVAYLGVQDPRYIIFTLACMKTGYVALVPSHRNSPAHFRSLFEATKMHRLVYSKKYLKLADSLQADRPSITSFEIPELEELVREISRPYPYTKTFEEAKDDPLITLHTSGSTGDPKPITYSNAFIATFDYLPRLPPYKGLEVCSVSCYGPQNGVQTRMVTAFPLFHLGGLFQSLGGLYFDAALFVVSPDVPVTAKAVLDLIKATKSRIANLPPSISNDLFKLYRSEFEECFSHLKVVMNAGGPLSLETGEWLSKRVEVLQVIGSTESGAFPQLKTGPSSWEWFHFRPDLGGIVMEPRDDDLFEMIVNREPGQEKIQGAFLNLPDLQVWRTKDLFRKHPTEPYYIFVGRLDDVIVLANGEKFNPVGFENTVNSNPYVRDAIVVGLRRNQTALLVEKTDNAPSSDEEFVEAIWPTIQIANKEAPGYGQLSKKMIIVAKPEKPFQRAAKGTVVRPRTVKDYESDIEELYKSVEEEGQDDSAPLHGMPVIKIPLESIQQFVQEHVALLLEGAEVSKTEDFFVLGFDSLQTIELNNNLRAGLKHFMQPSQLPQISLRLVYENPTAAKLGAAIYELMNPSANRGLKNLEAGTSQKTLDSMQALIDKYTSNLAGKAPITIKQTGQDIHVILTGSTGYLGQYILLLLLKDPKVAKVTCFNRSADAEAQYLSKGGIKQDVSKLEFLQVSFGEQNFGLPDDKYQELVNSVDAVIHNAWKVDFLHTVESYEEVHIRGVSNFVNLSLASPRSVVLSFISSVATCVNWSALHPGFPVPEAVNSDCRIPGMGYGQSKFIGENILDIAARERGISSVVLRSGQIAGPLGEEHGIWNKGEWFPTLMQTSKALGQVPATLGNGNVVDWIPVDVQASIIVDAIHSTIANGPSNGARAYNMVNPEHVPYPSLLKAIKEGLGEPKPVSLQTWVNELKKHDATSREDLERYPGLKLLSFYEAMIPEDGLMGTPYVHEKLNAASHTMATIAPVTGEAMASWLKQWNY